jgi:cell division septal protein FtsQ
MSDNDRDDAAAELRRDRRVERRLVWKVLFALAVVVVIVWARQSYFV